MSWYPLGVILGLYDEGDDELTGPFRVAVVMVLFLAFWVVAGFL